MKTKRDIIVLNSVIDEIKKSHSEEDVKPFKYAFLRNQLKFKKYVEERDSIIDFLKEEFLKDNPNTDDTDQKEYMEKYAEFVNTNDKFVSFLDEEIELDYYTVNIQDLEDVDFNMSIAEVLISAKVIIE